MSKIRIALSGPGWIGEQLLQAIHRHPQAEVALVSGPDEAASRAVMARVGIDPERYVPDFGRMVRDPGVDAVVLSGPNASHAPQALMALAAGRHVLSEKPNAVSEQEHVALVAAALASPGLVTMTDYIFHFDGMMGRARALIEAGTLGRLLHTQCNYRSPVNTTGTRAWKLRKEHVGDAIGMAITHAIYNLLHLTAPAIPVEVFAVSRPGISGDWEVHPIWTIQVRFSDGGTGVVLGDIESRNGYDAGIQVHGSEGAFVFDSRAPRPASVRYRSAGPGDDWIQPLDPACPDGWRWPDGLSTPTSGDVIGRSVTACVEHFIACIRSGVQSPLSFPAMRAVQDLSFAAQRSAASGMPVRVA